MPPRFFKHGELPLVILALLAETPRHGYDLMAELTRLFGPRYRASPGSIYPAVEALEAEGLIAGSPVGERVVYATTAAGDAALEDRAELLGALEERVDVQLGGESLSAVLNRFKARIAPLSGRIDAAEVDVVLRRAALEIELLATPTPSKRRTSHAG